MTKILAFTDIHMKDEGQTIIGLDPFHQFKTALDHAISCHPDAAQIVLMGDLANSGKISEYERVKTILAPCPIPFALIPGNHDNRVHMRSVFGDLPDTPQGHLQQFFDFGNDRVILLDTLDGPPFRNDYHIGVLCPDRLAWLRATIESTDNRRLSIFMHHEAFKIGMDGMDSIRLKNEDEFYELLSEYPNQKHVFCGHIHRTISGMAQGVGFTVFKSTCHQMPLILGAGVDSMSVAEPASYGVILLLDKVIVAHSEDFEVAIHDASHQAEALPDKNL